MKPSEPPAPVASYFTVTEIFLSPTCSRILKMLSCTAWSKNFDSRVIDSALEKSDDPDKSSISIEVKMPASSKVYNTSVVYALLNLFQVK